MVELALAKPELSPRELAYHIVDHEKTFISESSVYRILKAFDLVASPCYVVLSARDRFEHPTRRANEMWQTDFSVPQKRRERWEIRPPAIGLQERVANHRKRLWSKGMVVSVTEKAS